jgi:hypothetical protein
METGTALLIIAALYLTATNQAFRRFAIGAVTVGLVLTIGFFWRVQYVQEQQSIKYRASLPSIPSSPAMFADLTYCAGIGARNVPDKSCCPLEYQWSDKDQKCRLATSK